jgi:hypothetical protein
MDLKTLAAATIYKIPPIKPIPPGSNATTETEKTISMVIGLLTIFGVLYFTFQIIFAGYSYMSSNGDKAKLEESGKKLTQSIIGLTVIVIAMGLASLMASLLGIPNIFNLELVFTSMGL